MARILYLHRDPPLSQFIRGDLAILASQHQVDDLWLEPAPASMARLLWFVSRADLIYAWWGDLTGLLGVIAASARRRPSILISGGYDIADVPQLGYGLRHHPWRRHLPGAALKLASRVVVNSRSAEAEVQRGFLVEPTRLSMIPHGVDATWFTPGAVHKEPRVLTVSLLSRRYIPYKGLRTFLETARLMPEVPFVHAGLDLADGSRELLQREAPPNVRFLGTLSDDALRDQMRRSLVYAQLSAHEGFGLALAEAMATGATPVVTDCGAIPEVAGEVARYAPYGDAPATASAIRAALEAPRGAAARARIMTQFPKERRSAAILELVESALAASR